MRVGEILSRIGLSPGASVLFVGLSSCSGSPRAVARKRVEAPQGKVRKDRSEDGGDRDWQEEHCLSSEK